MLLASGVDAVVVKNELDYSSLNVTSRYLHLVGTTLKSASEAMARVVGSDAEQTSPEVAGASHEDRKRDSYSGVWLGFWAALESAVAENPGDQLVGLGHWHRAALDGFDQLECLFRA